MSDVRFGSCIMEELRCNDFKNAISFICFFAQCFWDNNMVMASQNIKTFSIKMPNMKNLKYQFDRNSHIFSVTLRNLYLHVQYILMTVFRNTGFIKTYIHLILIQYLI